LQANQEDTILWLLDGRRAGHIEKFFPHAEIFGVDINREALASARANYGQLITFLEPDHDSVLANGLYDLVTAMSVWCRHPPEFQSGRQIGLDFGVWSDALHQIDACLAEEGLLLLYNSNFAFRSHPVAAKYQPIRDPRFNEACFVNQFDESGRVLAEGHTVGPEAAHLGIFPWYERDLDSGDLSAWDLHDLCFQKSSGSAIARLSVDAEAPDEQLLATGVFGSNPHAAGLLTRPHRSLSTVRTEIAYRVFSNGEVLCNRTLQRTWFDGSIPIDLRCCFKFEGQDARQFLKVARSMHEFRL
jgi:hypothetical protein